MQKLPHARPPLAESTLHGACPPHPTDPPWPALEFAADPAMSCQIQAFCRHLVANTTLATIFPGFTAEDLCQDVLVSLAGSSCASGGQFWKLFEISARRRVIDLIRKSRTRLKIFDLTAGHTDDECAETPADSHHAFAAQAARAESSARELVEEIAESLGQMPVADRLRPVLDAIVHEIRTGERISDKEISQMTCIQQNTICRMRERVRAMAAARLGLKRPMSNGRPNETRRDQAVPSEMRGPS